MAVKGNPSEVDKTKREAIGTTAVPGLAPGTALAADDIDLENLGRLSEFPDLQPNDDPVEGTGEFVVILADYFTGVGEGDYFKKGDVRRMSRVIQGYADPKVNRDVVRGQIKRYLSIKAFRLATRDEQGQGHVEVTFETESDAVTLERNRRIQAENELELLRNQMGLAVEGQAQATPGRAGASGAAQAETAKQNEGKEKDDSNWE